MRKILIVLSLSLISLFGYSQSNALTFHGGYSWLTGLAGVEIQFIHLGFAFGCMPMEYPISQDVIPSFSAAATWYLKEYDESCFYGSLGTNRSGYRTEDANGLKETSPMTIAMIGYRFTTDVNVSTKLGCGYGWCANDKKLLVEWTFGYTFGF